MFRIKEEAKQAYDDWKKAIMSNDADFLENFYSDDFVSLSPCGVAKNKSEELARMRFKDLQYLYWQDKSVVINVSRESVFLRSRQLLQMQVFDLPVELEREIQLTFQKKDDTWHLKNISEHSI